MSTIASTSMTDSVPVGFHEVRQEAKTGKRIRAIAWIPLVSVTLIVVAVAVDMRWSLAKSLTWQCDEVPLLMRFTGLRGHAVNEAEAVEFTPTLYSFRKGALRSLRAPKFISAIHTTSGFWANLTIHLFGYSPGAGRATPFMWSMLAVGIAAWGTWILVRSIPAACVAAWMVALSPHAIAYAAQARGYAEAMALAPLLLILLEYFRRRPDSWIRAGLVFLCAIELSLTIYTLWVYWVFPVVLLSIFILPRMCNPAVKTRNARAVLIIMGLGLCSFMAVYTVDRWTQLTFTASHMGVTLNEPGAYWEFFGRLVHHLFPQPALLALFAIGGIWIIRRLPQQWWLWMIGVGVLVPAVFSVLNGSPGYERNFGYLLVPVAILAGIGVDAAMRVVARRIRPAVVAAVVGVAMIPTSVWAYNGLEQRSRAILLPDWGEMVPALDKEPESAGPRWLCHCLANHWQIGWYRKPLDYDSFLKVPAGGTIEVVMGAQLDEWGRPKVFRLDPSGASIPEEVLPDYIAATPPSETRYGIELRRWQAVGTTADDLASAESDAPVFVLAYSPDSPTTSEWTRFLNDINARPAGVVTFRSVPGSAGMLHSMIIPASVVPKVREYMPKDLHITSIDIRFFALRRKVTAWRPE